MLQDKEDLTLNDELKDDFFIVKVVYEDEKKAWEQEIEETLTNVIMSMEDFSYGAWLVVLSLLYDHKAKRADFVYKDV